MEASRQPRQGTGWAGFAGTMILLVGFFNVIWGVVALVDDDYFLSDQLLFWNSDGWGVILLIVGVLQILTAMLIFSGNELGAVLGIFFAMVNAVGHLLAIEAYPLWSIIIIVIDGLIIYALTVYGDALRE